VTDAKDDRFNADGNLLGRVVAFLLLVGAVVWLGRFLGR
jgi:hypothetical protein